MKKLMLALFLGFFLVGCGQLGMRSEFWQHDSIYKNWEHMKFSWSGDDPTAEEQQMSQEQGWWGIDVPYIPGQ